MEETITSRRNPLLAHTKKLLTSRAYREKSGEFAADGVKLLAEAARWYPGLHTVIAAEHVELCKLSDTVRVVRVPRDVMQSVSLMDAPQGAIFLCRTPQPPHDPAGDASAGRHSGPRQSRHDSPHGGRAGGSGRAAGRLRRHV